MLDTSVRTNRLRSAVENWFFLGVFLFRTSRDRLPFQENGLQSGGDVTELGCFFSATKLLETPLFLK
jgi:hypothetical protein